MYVGAMRVCSFTEVNVCFGGQINTVNKQRLIISCNKEVQDATLEDTSKHNVALFIYLFFIVPLLHLTVFPQPLKGLCSKTVTFTDFS